MRICRNSPLFGTVLGGFVMAKKAVVNGGERVRVDHVTAAENDGKNR